MATFRGLLRLTPGSRTLCQISSAISLAARKQQFAWSSTLPVFRSVCRSNRKRECVRPPAACGAGAERRVSARDVAGVRQDVCAARAAVTQANARLRNWDESRALCRELISLVIFPVHLRANSFFNEPFRICCVYLAGAIRANGLPLSATT